MSRKLVWDLPVRVGHWMLACAIAVAWATGESEQWKLVHIGAGAAAAALALFRLLWGFIGSAPARFAGFIKSPRAAWREIQGHLAGEHRTRASHTVLGGYSALALLGLALLAAGTGGLAYVYDEREWLGDLHEAAANTLFMLAGLHIAAAVGMSFIEGQNLPLSMLTGRRNDAPEEGYAKPRPVAALILIAWVAACVWLALHWVTNYLTAS